MNLRIIFLGLVLSFLPFIHSSAQTGFQHGVGLNYAVLFGDGNFIGNYGGEYSPRYNFVATDAMSISASSHISLNLNQYEGGGIAFFFMSPLLAGANFGYLSTSDNDANFGGYVEAGYTAGWTIYSDVGGFFHGPMVSGGIRFQRVVNNIGLYYVKPVNLSGASLVGIRVGRDF